MNIKIVSKIAYCIIASVMCMSLAGCSVMPTLALTEEQNSLIAEYAAGLLVKYEKDHKMGIAPITEEEPSPDTMVLAEEPVLDAVITEDLAQDTVPESLNAAATEDLSNSQQVDLASVSLGEAFGAEGFDVSFDKYEVQYIYPPQESDDLVFSMQASPGMSLLVLHFNLTNNNESSMMFDAASENVKARVSINGEKRIPAQTTILLNDLLTFRDEVAGYGMVDTVIVFEVPEDVEQSLSSMNLTIVGPSGENSYSIF